MGRIMSGKDTFQKLRAIDRIDRALISPGAASLLSYLQRVERPGRWHFATRAALASALKRAESTISRWIEELRSAGFLAVWNRKARTDAGMRYIARGFQIVRQAIDLASSAGADAKAAAVTKARLAMKAATERVLAAFRSRKRSCPTVGQMTPQTDKKMLWKLLGQAVEGSPEWASLVAALIRVGEGQSEGEFRGFGRP